MIELSGYVFETLREDEEVALYRGRKDSDLSPILMAAPVSEHPIPGILKRLEHEYALRDELDSEWAARPLALVRREGRTMLILEDPGGQPLDRLLGQPMELTPFLRLAVGLVGALSKLHQRGLIHKDIKPANIFVNSATGAIWRRALVLLRDCPANASPQNLLRSLLAHWLTWRPNKPGV